MDFDYGLLAKYLTGNISFEEKEEIVNWSNLSQENKQIFSDLIRLHISWNLKLYDNPQHIDKALNVVNGKINHLNHLLMMRIVLKYVAVFLLLISLSYGSYEYFKTEQYVTISVKSAEKVKKVRLTDGTTVWLRGGSTLKYPESFSSTKRHVFLQGEAFFDVIKNTRCLFSVTTDFMNVQVRGTTFDVKIDDKNKKVETVLVTGKIDLLDTSWKKVMEVSPGEKVTYNQDNNEYTTEVVDINIFTAWRLQQFILENATLREIANKLSVKFNVNINIESSTLAQRKFRCVINEDETLEDILNFLKYLAPIHYKVEGNEVFIYDNKKELPMIK